MRISDWSSDVCSSDLLSTHGNTLAEAAKRMDRALREFRIRGVKNNIGFLENLITHPVFLAGEATVGFIAAHPELFKSAGRLDRGTKLLEFLGDISVNGNADVKGASLPSHLETPRVPPVDIHAP